MEREDPLSELEQLVLLALVRLGEAETYGVPIHREIETTAGLSPSVASVYAALGRLEDRRLVVSWHSEPVAERGGRARKHFRLSPAGARALGRSQRVMQRMWDGVELAPYLGSSS